MYWSKYEDNLLLKLKEDNLSYKEIQEVFSNDPKCLIRSLDSLSSHYLKIKKEKNMSSIKYDEILSDLKNAPIKIEDLNSIYGIDEETVFNLIEELNNNNVPVFYEEGYLKLPVFKNKTGVNYIDKEILVDIEEIDDPYDIRIGIISDTHIGSKASDINSLNQFYSYAKTQGVRHIFNAGDLTDGVKVYPGQTYEQTELGFEGQLQKTVNEYPNNGIKTYVISGNHDYSFMAHSYADIIKSVCSVRSDFINCGYYQGSINIGGIKIKLHHPDGGLSYALSYKLQKILESNNEMSNYDIFVMGHYHQSILLYNYVTKLAMMPGSFQRDTPFSKRKGLKNIIGGYIVRIKTSRITKIREYITHWYDLQ